MLGKNPTLLFLKRKWMICVIVGKSRSSCFALTFYGIYQCTAQINPTSHVSSITLSLNYCTAFLRNIVLISLFVSITAVTAVTWHQDLQMWWSLQRWGKSAQVTFWVDNVTIIITMMIIYPLLLIHADFLHWHCMESFCLWFRGVFLLCSNQNLK